LAARPHDISSGGASGGASATGFAPALAPVPTIPAPKTCGLCRPGESPASFARSEDGFPHRDWNFPADLDFAAANYPSNDIAWLRQPSSASGLHFVPGRRTKRRRYAAKMYIENRDLGQPAYDIQSVIGHPSLAGVQRYPAELNPSAPGSSGADQDLSRSRVRFLLSACTTRRVRQLELRYSYGTVNISPHRDLLSEWSRGSRPGPCAMVSPSITNIAGVYQALSRRVPNNQGSSAYPTMPSRFILTTDVGQWCKASTPHAYGIQPARIRRCLQRHRQLNTTIPQASSAITGYAHWYVTGGHCAL